MSMLSSQIDTLRKAAQTCRDMGKYSAESMILDAADTIWQLRDDLQRANAENERLRQELAVRETSAQEAVIEYLRQENVDWEDRYRALAAENAKLRKLVKEMRVCLKSECRRCHAYELGDTCDLDQRMRELGVEV